MNAPAVAWLASAVLAAVLLWLAAIDLRTLRLPDRIVLPTLLAGLLLNAFSVLCTPLEAWLGAFAGYGLLATLSAAWTGWRGGPAAMGGGDLKLAAAIGAWIGIGALPGALFAAFVIGTLAALPALASGRLGPRAAVPFGPALAAGGIAALLGLPSLVAGSLAG